jgi:hypothetical protein
MLIADRGWAHHLLVFTASALVDRGAETPSTRMDWWSPLFSTTGTSPSSCLSLATSACIPIPSEITYVVAGALCTTCGHRARAVLTVGRHRLGTLAPRRIPDRLRARPHAGRPGRGAMGEVATAHPPRPREVRAVVREVRLGDGALWSSVALRAQFHLRARGYRRDEPCALCATLTAIGSALGRATGVDSVTPRARTGIASIGDFHDAELAHHCIVVVYCSPWRSGTACARCADKTPASSTGLRAPSPRGRPRARCRRRVRFPVAR